MKPLLSISIKNDEYQVRQQGLEYPLGHFDTLDHARLFFNHTLQAMGGHRTRPSPNDVVYGQPIGRAVSIPTDEETPT